MAHSVWLLSIGERFPHQDSEAPDVTLTGELVVVDAFGGVPLHGPLPVGLGLEAEWTFHVKSGVHTPMHKGAGFKEQNRKKPLLKFTMSTQ